MRNILFSFLVLFFLSGLIIYPATPSTGLPGIAVSPNGKIVAAGGISRVIYLINPVKMEVTGRILKIEEAAVYISLGETARIAPEQVLSVVQVDLIKNEQGRVIM